MTTTRRNFMQNLASGAIGLSQALFPAWMPRLAFNQTLGVHAQDVLVVIFQRGGMDGLTAVVPFGEGAGYYDRRPTLAIAEPDGSDSSAIDLDGFFGLHPNLRPLKDVYDNGHLAVIHATGSIDPTRSHFDAMAYMERGIPGDKLTASGWITRHLATAAWENQSPFRAVGMGTIVPSSLQGTSALSLRSTADFHLQGRPDQLAQIQRTISGLYTVEMPSHLVSQAAGDVFSTIDLLKQLSATNYQPAYGAAYPDSAFGMGLRQVAQLIKANVGLEVACVDIDGWDTHENQNNEIDGLLSDFGQGLAAFYHDMQDHIGNITVVTMSEFGRRATENASAGTDHGHGNCMFIMGGGTVGGVYADWPGLNDAALDDGDLAITIDYRDTLAEVLTKRVLNPAIDQIFPNYTATTRGILQEKGV